MKTPDATVLSSLAQLHKIKILREKGQASPSKTPYDIFQQLLENLEVCVCLCMRACVCWAGAAHRTLLARELILRVQLEIALLKQFFGKSFASDPSWERDPQVMRTDPRNGTVQAQNRAVSPAKPSLGSGSLAGHGPVRRPSQKPRRDSGKCPPVSVPSRTVLAAYSCIC